MWAGTHVRLGWPGFLSLSGVTRRCNRGPPKWNTDHIYCRAGCSVPSNFYSFAKVGDWKTVKLFTFLLSDLFFGIAVLDCIFFRLSEFSLLSQTLVHAQLNRQQKTFWIFDLRLSTVTMARPLFFSPSQIEIAIWFDQIYRRFFLFVDLQKEPRESAVSLISWQKMHVNVMDIDRVVDEAPLQSVIGCWSNLGKAQSCLPTLENMIIWFDFHFVTSKWKRRKTRSFSKPITRRRKKENSISLSWQRNLSLSPVQDLLLVKTWNQQNLNEARKKELLRQDNRLLCVCVWQQAQG